MLELIKAKLSITANGKTYFMKVTLNWLKQYVDFNWSSEELTGRLTLSGLDLHNRFTNRILWP